MKSNSGALFGRSDVARLLNIPEWALANFADRRYPYGLVPSISGGRGRGKKSLYTLIDVYKVALAWGLFLVHQDSDMIAEIMKALFPKNKEPTTIAVDERRADEDARWIVVDLYQYAQGTWTTELPDETRSPVPEEWRGKDSPTKRYWVALHAWKAIGEAFSARKIGAAIIVPFDDTLNRVDGLILGREVTPHRHGKNGRTR